MEKEYQALVEDTTQQCAAYFGDRLLAAYVSGSIYTGDAIYGESDLDYYVVTADVPSQADREWIGRTQTALDERYPAIRGGHITVYPLETLKEDRFAPFALRYNAMLCYGKDIAARIGGGFTPGPEIAKWRLSFARRCLEEALDGSNAPACMGELPANTYQAARKFARYFVIIEGAYLLMTKGYFETFERARVLEQLRAHTTGFDDLLSLSARVAYDPIAAGIGHTDYLLRIRSLVEWIFDEIERA